MQDKQKGRTRFRIGWTIFATLTGLTILEYWLGVAVSGATPYLSITAFLKGILIIVYFMHISQLWSSKEEHE